MILILVVGLSVHRCSFYHSSISDQVAASVSICLLERRGDPSRSVAGKRDFNGPDRGNVADPLEHGVRVTRHFSRSVTPIRGPLSTRALRFRRRQVATISLEYSRWHADLA